MEAQQNNENKVQEFIKPKENQPKKFYNQIPEDILHNEKLNELICILPSNYNFEIHKTIWRIQELKKALNKDRLLISLQFPEGLLMYACIISDIIEHFTNSECIIMGDVTYGACCIDDISSDNLKADFIIHYGHSCLIPIDETCVKTLYVFVEIMIDIKHLISTIELNFPNKETYIYLMGTVQFNTAMFMTKKNLEEKGYSNISIPQEKPRSPGEILGCTSPVINFKEDHKDNALVLFICDGRFHMESAMIANPQLKFYQYNPYNKAFTIESYNHKKMLETRKNELNKFQNIKRVGIILGVLGRQGNIHILERIEAQLKEKNIPYIVLMVSEIFDSQLKLFQDEIDIWIQIACPRISVDWGTYFTKPIINPYEFFVAIKKVEWKQVYPMDYYSNNGGEWTNYFHKQQQLQQAKANSKKKYTKIEYETKN